MKKDNRGLYTIYHVKGIKVGCTVDINRRSSEYRRSMGSDVEIEILQEVPTSAVTKEEIGDIEWHYAEKFGYAKGRHYKHVSDYTPELRARLSEAHTGLRLSEESKAKLSKHRKGKTCSEQQKIDISETLKNKPEVECPHCGKVGKGNAMKRWHFNNCRL